MGVSRAAWIEDTASTDFVFGVSGGEEHPHVWLKLRKSLGQFPAVGVMNEKGITSGIEHFTGNRI